MPNFSPDTLNDFRFVKKVTAADVAGKKVMVDEQGRMINAGLYLTETRFLQDWATMFALGKGSGKNYFDTNAWLKAVHTMNNATRTGLSCVVTNDEKTEILFVIQPITEPNFTPEERAALSDVHSWLVNARNAADAQQMNQKMNEGAQYAHDAIAEGAGDYCDMIPAEWWAKHNIHPLAMQRAVYMRDEFGVINEDFDVVYGVFIKMSKGEEVSKEEKDFVIEKSQGQFSFDDYSPTEVASKKVLGGESNRISPFEC